MNKPLRAALLAWTGPTFLLGCAAQGLSGAEKADAYHPQEAERAESNGAPQPIDTTSELSLPECAAEGAAPPFPKDSDGAAFRGMVHLTITEDGKAEGACYLVVEGDRKWEKKALGDHQKWSFSPEHAGQPRERTILWRKP